MCGGRKTHGRKSGGRKMNWLNGKKEEFIFSKTQGTKRYELIGKIYMRKVDSVSVEG